MWHAMQDWDGGWGWFGVMHLFWWVIVIGALVLLVRSLAGSLSTRSATADRPLQILQRRYARGEIDTNEFEDRVRHLEQAGTRGE